MFERIKNIWAWGAVNPVTIEKTDTPNVYVAVDKRHPVQKAQFIPHNKRNPAEEIINEQPHE